MIIQNALKITEDGKVTYLNSINRHDFREYSFKDGTMAFTDGGAGANSYIRRGGRACGLDPAVTDWSLSDDMDFELIKSRLLWGTRGKDGKQPLTYVSLIECETSHLEAIKLYTAYGKPIPDLYFKVIDAILKERQAEKEEAFLNFCECCGNPVGLSKSVFNGRQILCEKCKD